MARLTETIVHAAGGILWRRGESGLEFLLVHRPNYGDWSFAKGKLDPGESHEEAALREVREETGFHCELGEEVATASYRDRKGRPKIVRYWTMTTTGGTFVPDEEVDAIVWLSRPRARQQLSYDRDKTILDAVDSLPQ